jgi:hypothetical protein
MRFENYSRVVLLTNRYEDEGVKTGDIGYIIEVYDDGKYEIEISDRKTGITIAQIVVREDEIALRELSG